MKASRILTLALALLLCLTAAMPALAGDVEDKWPRRTA